jgi:hypothetical protein
LKAGRAPSKYLRVTLFHASADPEIAVRDYMSRISRYGRSSLACFLSALILMERIAQVSEGFLLSYFNVHRILVTCVLISTKMMDDHYFSNKYWARIAGISPAELFVLEIEALQLLRWNTFVSLEEFTRYHNALRNDIVPMIAPTHAVAANCDKDEARRRQESSTGGMRETVSPASISRGHDQLSRSVCCVRTCPPAPRQWRSVEGPFLGGERANAKKERRGSRNAREKRGEFGAGPSDKFSRTFF